MRETVERECKRGSWPQWRSRPAPQPGEGLRRTSPGNGERGKPRGNVSRTAQPLERRDVTTARNGMKKQPGAEVRQPGCKNRASQGGVARLGGTKAGPSLHSLLEFKGGRFCQGRKRNFFEVPPFATLNHSNPVPSGYRTTTAHRLGGLVRRANVAGKFRDARPEVDDVGMGHS